MKLCPGTIDWHCKLEAGHKEPHVVGVLKSMTGPVPMFNRTAENGLSDSPSTPAPARRTRDGRPPRKQKSAPASL